MATHETCTLTTTIDAPIDAVVAHLADPAKHPGWATEFFAGPTRPAEDPADGEVLADVPMLGGPARFRIVATAELGVIDLYLAPQGRPFGPPLPVRVVANGTGADVLWTLARPAHLPDAAWHAGQEAMRRELDALRAQLEISAEIGPR